MTTHVDEIRQRYAEEREKRVREDRDKQFGYLDEAPDPWSEPIVREPVNDAVDAVVVGAGLSGLTTAAMLKKAGLPRVRLIDRAGDVGGTWYWNRYPAAQCDIESYVYLPLLEELDFVPSEKYAYQAEIFGHLQGIAKKFELYGDALFQTGVVDASWSDDDKVWIVRTDRDDEIRAQFLVMAGGFLQRPKLPAIPGLEDFQGKLFHSSRWDYDYTGGAPGVDGGGLPKLQDKKVALIGTGATGLQVLTPVARAAEHVYVFQRTPSIVLERNNRPTDPEWAASLQSGWHRERIENFELRTNGRMDEIDLVQDGWTQIYAPILVSHGVGLYGGPEEQTQAEVTDLKAMDRVRQRVADIVKDPATAAALMPYYRMLCKRVGFHDEYLQSFNRENVTLVDTAGAGVDKVTERGVVVNGTEYEVDLLILATGFDTNRGLLTSWGADPIGRNGIRLSEYWSEGMRTLHGVMTHNFPNCFFVSVTQVAITANFGAYAVEMADHIAHIVSEVAARGASSVEVTEEAEAEWVERIRAARPERQLEFQAACTPGYYNNEGNLANHNRLGENLFFGGSVQFAQILREWRTGALSGLEIE